MKRKKISDSTIYVTTRYGAFILASIISALFNLLLFAALDPSSRPLLMGMSIALEGAKLTTVLSYNVMSAMYLKLKVKSLRTKAHLFLGFYLIYGLLSMTASLGFSTVATSKRAAMENNQLTTVATKIEQVQSIIDRVSDYETMKDVALSDYRPYIEAQAQILQARNYELERRALYTEADDVLTRLGAATRNGSLTSDDDQNWRTKNADYVAAQQTMFGFRTQYQAAQSETRRLQQELNRITTEYNEGGDRAAERIADLMKQFDVLRESMGMEVGITPAAAITTLEEEAQAIKNQILETKGMGYMFDKFSEFTGGKVSSTGVMFAILALISVLLEITVYQCSPDIQIDRHVLRFFRRSLPKDRTVEEIVELFDSEAAMFEYTEEKLEPVEETSRKRSVRKKPASVVVSLDQDGDVEEKPLVVKNSDVVERPMAEVDLDPKYMKPLSVQREEESDVPFVIDAEIGKHTAVAKSFENSVHKAEPNFIGKEDKVADLNNAVNIQLTANSKLPGRDASIKEKTKDTVRSEHIAEEINDGSSNVKERYRFATTTPFVVLKFSEFIDKCIGPGPGPFILDPIEVAKEMKLNTNSREVFLGRLTRLMSGGKPLVERDEDGRYRSNFGSKEIIEYVSQKV